MNISISELLQSTSDKKFIRNKIICFKADKYTCLFFSLFFRALKKINNLEVSYIKIEEIELSALKLSLEQCFLINTERFFWLGDISNFKKKDDFLLYLNSYKGPHAIGFFVNTECQIDFDKRIDEVSCNNIVSVDQLNSFLFLWNKKDQKTILTFIKNILQRYNKLNLDQLCILANYAILLGSRYSAFMDSWLENILSDDYSLFTLSKYFFSNDSKSFFKYWNLISDNYAPVFWTSFWSEQLYRSFNFIILRNQNKNLQAKQIAYKLPFSFIQTYWKKFSVVELQQAHNFIYEIDHSLKNGASDISLDLFYAKFFAKEFR